jgi:hypothetical protein
MINFNLNIPSKDSLLAADALLYAVYGYKPEKVKDLKLTEIERLVKKAEKEMTWFQAYKFKSLLESKPKSLWAKIFSKTKH